ncbi:MAG: hypothetical protein ACAH80_04280 [Alphaproteobacteria bacterium]
MGMFQKLKTGLKDFWVNPYAAPLTEAVKGVIHYARMPINKFIKGCAHASDDNNYKYDTEGKAKSKMARLMDLAEKYESGMGFIVIGGAVVGALAFGGAGVAAGIVLMGGVVGKTVMATVLGLALCGVGYATGPYIAAGIAATAGGMVGLGLGMVPGFIKGCKNILQHHKDLKTQGAVAAALPKSQAQDAELTKNLAAVMQHFNNLPKEHKGPFVRMMNDKHAQAATAPADKILAQIDAMPEQDRDALLRSLRDRLKEDFSEVAQKDADDSVVLQAPVTAAKIKLKGATPDA